MVLSQRVQSCQFDSKLVNAQCSDSFVVCVCARACVYHSKCMMKIPFHLFEALVLAEAVGADQRTTLSPPGGRDWHHFCINLEDLFVKKYVYWLNFFPTDFIYKKLFIERSIIQYIIQQPPQDILYSYINIYWLMHCGILVISGWNSSGCNSWLIRLPLVLLVKWAFCVAVF